MVFSCDQAVLWMVQSIRLFVCPSHLFYYVPIIVSSWNFQEWLQKWCPCNRSKVKVTEVKTQFRLFWTVTPVWIPTWRWNDVQSLMWHRRGAYCIPRSSVKLQGHTGQNIADFHLNVAFPDCNSSLNWPELCTKLEIAYKRCPIAFQGHPSNC